MSASTVRNSFLSEVPMGETVAEAVMSSSMSSRAKPPLSVSIAAPGTRRGDGGPGANNNKTGKNGATVRLPVPAGTIFRDNETGEVLCELVGEDAEAVVAKGGKGGRGNSSFATPTHQVPRRAEPGGMGEARDLTVELKIVADIGLVGFPNAGKSTLLNAITSAHAKIGQYPFTTLHPVLGTIPLEPHEEAEWLKAASKGKTERSRPRIIIADIPGIVEGAHQGTGLGLDFLRHIERTRVLLFVVDVSINREYEPLEAYAALLEEVGSYKAELLAYPRLVALSKIDQPLESEEIDLIEKDLRDCMNKESPRPHPGEVFRISALEGKGLEPLRRSLVELILRNIEEESEIGECV